VIWAIGFLAAGLVVVGLLSLWRRPKRLESWLFVTLVLLLIGVVSLGVTGSALAFVFTPILNLIGFPSVALRDSWLGAMALSFLCPPGLLMAHLFARQRRTYWLIFLVSFFLYCLLMSVIVYFIVERV
jgi:hypothetical protein